MIPENVALWPCFLLAFVEREYLRLALLIRDHQLRPNNVIGSVQQGNQDEVLDRLMFNCVTLHQEFLSTGVLYCDLVFLAVVLPIHAKLQDLDPLLLRQMKRHLKSLIKLTIIMFALLQHRACGNANVANFTPFADVWHLKLQLLYDDLFLEVKDAEPEFGMRQQI